MSDTNFCAVKDLPPGSLTFETMITEDISASPDDRLDQILCTKEIDGLLFYADDTISVLSFLRVDRSPEGKLISGVTGLPSN